MIKQLCAAVALVVLCGCFKVKDELSIEPDGSGVVRLEARSSMPSEMLGAMGMGNRGGGIGVLYPPVSEAEAKQFFPEKDFKLTVSQKASSDGGAPTVTVEARFKDINTLLASPYGKAHSLHIEKTNGTLRLRALTGIEGVARMADVERGESMGFGAAFGADEMKKQKNEMRLEFRVTLPQAATASAGGVQDGKSATWTFERAKFTNGAEFATLVGKVLEVSCPANGISINPTNLPRLGLQSFADLQPASTSGSAVDAAKVAAAAKFIPCALRVTRTLDLSGEGGGRENNAELVGAVVLPSSLKPSRWGKATLEEAVDAKGTNLKPAKDNDFSGRFSNISRTVRFGGDEDEDNEGKTTATDAEERQLVTLSFRPPDWKVKEIARIKGSVALQYFGGSHVVKLSNAIPAKLIMDPMSGRSMMRDGAKVISDPKLTELGVKLEIGMAMAQSGMLTINLSIEGDKSGFTDAQVFDADGHPWPTMFQPDEGGGGDRISCNLFVPGSPKPPLSLALLASGGGQKVEVPILVEKVPVRR